MKSVGVGVVGVGFMGTNHANTYRTLPGAELVGVVDVDVQRAESLAKKLGIRWYRNTPDLLADTRIEAVSICTNDERHVQPVIDAARAAKHILLEKPIATTLRDADTILSSIGSLQTSGKCFFVGHILRFEPRYLEAKHSVDRGDIGDVVSIFARRLNAVSAQAVLKGRVSVLSFLGVHDYDICHWIAGAPAKRVYCEVRSGYNTSRGFDVEDQTFTVLRFDNNVIACVEAGWVLPDTHSRKADFSLEVVGTKGVVNLDLMSQGIAICNEQGYRFPPSAHGLEYELSHFLRCIRGEESPGISGTEAKEALEISLAAQRSALLGEPVHLPLTE